MFLNSHDDQKWNNDLESIPAERFNQTKVLPLESGAGVEGPYYEYNDYFGSKGFFFHSNFALSQQSSAS